MVSWRYFVLFYKKEINQIAVDQKKEEERKRKKRLKEILIEAMTLTSDKEFIKLSQAKIDYISSLGI